MAESRIDPTYLSVIIPVYNGGAVFERCLRSLRESSFRDYQLIVVDDGSDDGSEILAAKYGGMVLHTPGRVGPGAARNQGADQAAGEFILFLDADCEVGPNTLALAAGHLRADPSLDALFGSYDDEPAVPKFVSRYKNLQHHYVHQNASEDASTFWAGCGAVRRSVFLRLGGFDVRRYDRPSIEDIELGYRLKAQGHRIKLAKDVQVKHHKRWTLRSLIKTDVFDRGIPWTVLLLTNKQVVNDLNLDTRGRSSVAAAVLLFVALVLALADWRFLWLAVGLAVLLLVLNLPFYRFFYRQGGAVFALGCIALHWMYFLYSAFAYAAGHLAVLWSRS